MREQHQHLRIKGKRPGNRTDLPIFRARIAVRRIPLVSVTSIAALIRIPMNADERRQMRPKMRPRRSFAHPATRARARRAGGHAAQPPPDDLARWGWWGIPSTWRSPATRAAPGATSPASHRPSAPGLPPGPRVVALRGGRRDAPPVSPRTQPARVCGRLSRSFLPARRGHVFGWTPLRSLRSSTAEATPIRASTAMSTAVQRSGL
jgi:hypothetical protein